jgi:2-polyprenyl-3-methyl-5-hydroxy-6-metoxy-1,4-benzoquinol methylase
MTAPAELSGYVLGHDERELQRLTRQAALIEPITRGFLLEAGIVAGMTVLDVGTGVGDVAFLLAEMVGPTGSVVGVDRSPAAVAAALERGKARTVANVSFEVANLGQLTFDTGFDAVVGRYVLQFQPDPAAILGRLAACTRPGGIIAFHEIDWSDFRSWPQVAAWERVRKVITESLTAAGASARAGTELASVFADAGLGTPELRMAAIIGAGAGSRDVVERTVGVALTLLRSRAANGLPQAEDFDPETIADHVLRELTAAGSVAIGASEIAAWVHI